MPVTLASKEIDAEDESIVPEKVWCTYYLLSFWKNTADVEVFIDFGSKIKAMILVYTSKLGFKARHTNVKT